MFGLPLLRISAWANVVLAIAVFVVWSVQEVRVSSAQKAELKAVAALSEANAKISKEREEFERKAREQEKAMNEKLAEAERVYDEQMRNALATKDRVIADLSAGAIRLRNHWRGCIATSELSRSAEAQARASEDDRLRRESAGRIVSIVSECQAQRDGLIGVVRSILP